MDGYEFFRNLDFSEYESKVLNSFNRLGKVDTKELSKDSGVPQNKLYAILKKFEGLGILEAIQTEPKKYKLINIDVFIKKKINEKEERVKELKKNSTRLTKFTEEKAVFSLIKGQEGVMNKLAQTNSKATREIVGVQRNWKFWAEGIREMEKSIKKGVKVRFIGIVNKENIHKVLEWKNIGCEIRVYNSKYGEHPLRFSVIDGKYCRLTIGKPEILEPKEYITVWTDSNSMVKMLKNQFEDMWKNSVPIEKLELIKK